MINNLKDQFKQLKKVKTIVILALLIALAMCISQFTIKLGPTLVISFSYLIAAICSMMFGPAIGGLFGLICDNVKYFLNPMGAYFPLFAINEILAGIIYGVFFYKKDITLKNSFIAYGMVCLFLNVLLNPLWLNILYGKGYLFYVSERLVTNLVGYPIKALILYFVLSRLKKVIK